MTSNTFMEVLFQLKRHLDHDMLMEHDWASTWWLYRRLQEELKELQESK